MSGFGKRAILDSGARVSDYGSGGAGNHRVAACGFDVTGIATVRGFGAAIPAGFRAKNRRFGGAGEPNREKTPG